MYKIWNFVGVQSGTLLIGGACIALIWANALPHSYESFIHFVLIDDFVFGDRHEEHHTLTVHYLVNDVLMALFFAVAGKEVWEAVRLPHGKLHGKEKALTPLFATAGGVVGPIAVYLGIAALFGSTTFQAVAQGWAVPTATDIAFSLVVGRWIFGKGHPAVNFLLLLAIVDDAVGLVIIAVFYSDDHITNTWLWSFAVAFLVYLFCNWLPRQLDNKDARRLHTTWMRRHLGAWPYIVAGGISWYLFQESGIHPALGLLPIIPAIPHAGRDFGIFADVERYHTDLLNYIEHRMKSLVGLTLLLFGLVNAGVQVAALAEPTWLVALGLIVGKPLGIFIFGVVAVRFLGLQLPAGMGSRELLVLGCVAGLGFTVALFVAGEAFPPGALQDAAKMGALASFSAAIVALVAARVLRIKRITEEK